MTQQQDRSRQRATRSPLKVLVVDDSALMRRLLSELLASEPDIEVVGTARDGAEAVEKTKALRPHVVTMDVQMPHMDGLEALGHIMREVPTPVVILTGLEDEAIALEALSRGAVDVVLKPSGPISVDIAKVKEELVHKVRMARAANIKRLINGPVPGRRPRPPVEPPPTVGPGTRMWAVVIAASTGGPRAVEYVLCSLPGNLPATVLVVQHMPPGFTRSFAERLNRICNLNVREAQDEDVLEPGHAFIAPGGYHMRVARGTRLRGTIHLDQTAPVNGVRPSADVTMMDVARVFGARTVGVVLTGMGADGAQGLLAIREAGGITIAQDQVTSVVYGMPRMAVTVGGARTVLPLEDIPAAIVRAVTKREEGRG